MEDEIISSENITQDLLKGYFDKAYFSTFLDDKGNLFIKDRYRVYLDINPKKSNITFSIIFNFRADCTELDRLGLANTINNELNQIKAISGTNRITIEYDVWIEGGALVKNIISAYRSFVSQVAAAVGKDKKLALL